VNEPWEQFHWQTCPSYEQSFAEFVARFFFNLLQVKRLPTDSGALDVIRCTQQQYVTGLLGNKLSIAKHIPRCVLKSETSSSQKDA